MVFSGFNWKKTENVTRKHRKGIIMKRIFKRGIVIFTCLALMLGAFASCTVQRAYQGAPEGMRPINEGDEGGILYVPIAWSVDTSTGVPTAYVSDKNRTMITLVTVAADKVPEGGITAYFDSYRESFASTLKDFKIIKENEEASDYTTRMISTAGAYIYEYSGSVTNIKCKFKQAFFLHPENGTLFIITYSAIENVYENYLKTLTEAYDNFRFVAEPIPMVDKVQINLPSTEGIDVPEGYTLISNKFVDYHFFVPNTWSPSVNTGMSAAYASSNKRTTVNVVAFNTTFTSLDDYWAGYEEDLKATFGEVTYTGGETKYTASKLGSVDARNYSYKITRNGIEYLYNQHVVIYGGYVYTLTFCCESTAYETYKADFDGMLANFRFKA